jgi:hypothetical protein
MLSPPTRCVSDGAKGFVNFWAGAGNFVTTTVTFGKVHIDQPFCGPGLDASYSVGEWTAGIESLLGLRAAGGTRWFHKYIFSLGRTSQGGRVVTIGGGLLRYVGYHLKAHELPLHTRHIELLWKFVWRW